jgi:hypothetical protein
MSTEPSRLRAASSYAGATATEGLDSDRRPQPAPVPPEPDAGTPVRRRQRTAEAGRAAPDRRPRPPRRSKRKVRKVHRVVRHVEVWSVAKVTAAFVACGYVVGLVSGYLLWRAADRVGTIDGIEGFVEDSGSYDSFEILGGVVFRVAAVTGAAIGMLVLAAVVLGALLFNLISDLTGGIRMTVIDEDLIVAPARRRGGPPAPGTTDPAGRDSS